MHDTSNLGFLAIAAGYKAFAEFGHEDAGVNGISIDDNHVTPRKAWQWR